MEGFHYLCSENNAVTTQLLCTCFHMICKKQVFSWHGPNVPFLKKMPKIFAIVDVLVKLLIVMCQFVLKIFS